MQTRITISFPKIKRSSIAANSHTYLRFPYQCAFRFRYLQHTPLEINKNIKREKVGSDVPYISYKHLNFNDNVKEKIYCNKLSIINQVVNIKITTII